jgi:acyl carrier protein
MRREDVLARLSKIFADVLNKPLAALQEGSTAREIPGWDSLSHINIVLAVEQEFNIRLRASQIARVKNIGGFVDIVLEKLKARA